MSGPVCICVGTQKGGAGKTTMAMMVADNLHQKGKKVLLVDTDPQGSAHKWEGKVLEGSKPFPVRVDHVHGLKPEAFLAWLEKRIDNIDYVVIDTPPSLNSTELRTALFVSQTVLIPVEAHASSLDALEELVPLINRIGEERGMPIDARLVVTQYTGKYASERAIADSLTDLTPFPVLDTRMKFMAAFKDAYNYRTSIFHMKGTKAARNNVTDLIDELLGEDMETEGGTA